MTAADFAIPWDGSAARAIGLIEDQVVTENLTRDPLVVDGLAVSDPERDLVKIAVVERHLGTGRMGLAFVAGSGLQRGAFASTVAHDAHNLVVVGANDDDMAFAVNRLAEVGGGIVVVEGGRVWRSARCRSPGCSPTSRSTSSSTRAARATRPPPASAGAARRRS